MAEFEAAVPAAVEPASVESVRDDVEEVVVEQTLAQERNRHTASAVSAAPTEEAARTNLALPMSPVLTRAQADEVVAAVGVLTAA